MGGLSALAHGALVTALALGVGCSGGGGGGGDGSAVASGGLVAVLVASPERLSEGQAFDVTLEIHNTSATTFLDVEASSLEITGTGGIQRTGGGSGPVTGLTLAPGGQHLVVDSFQATASGTTTFSRVVAGVRSTTGEAVVLPAAVASVLIERPAHIAVGTPILVGAPTRTGDVFTIEVPFENIGEAAAEQVEPRLTVLQGSLDVLDGPTPDLVDLASGATAACTFTVRAGGAGDLEVSATAVGLDANTGLAAQVTPSGATTPLSIAASAALDLRAQAAPSAVSSGQEVELIVTLTNVGDRDAAGVVIAIAPDLAGALDPASPRAVGALAAGAEAEVRFGFTTQQSGTLTFAVTVAGEDAGDGHPLAAGPEGAGPITVQVPAALSVQVSVDRAQAEDGDLIGTSVLVTNTGEATALAVAPDPLALTVLGIDADAVRVTGPEPREQDVPGGASRAFVYRFNPRTSQPGIAGSVAFSAGAIGTDQNLGTAVPSTSATSTAVAITPRAYQLDLALLLGSVEIRQDVEVDVTLRLTNPGTEDAIDVTGSVVALGSNGGSVRLVAAPGPVTIPAGDTADLVFRFAGEDTGQVTFSAEAEGIGATSGATLTSPFETSDEVLVVAGPPVITAADPATGPAAGGTLVTVTGRRFAPGMLVSVGGVPATRVRVLSSTEATLVTPPAAAGLAAGFVATSATGDASPAVSVFAYDADTQAPVVRAFVPPPNASSVLRNRKIVLSFSEAIDASSLGLSGPGSSVTATNGGDLLLLRTLTFVAGTITLGPDRTKLVYAPSANLERNSDFTTQLRTASGQPLRDVHGNALDYAGSAGNAQAGQTASGFETGGPRANDEQRPTLTSSSPAAGAAGVDLEAALELRFSEPMDPRTISAVAIGLERAGAPATVIPVTVRLSDDCTRAFVEPHLALDPATSYTLIATMNVSDLAGLTPSQEIRVPFATERGDEDPPTITKLTLSEVTPELNGTGQAGGILQVPTSGFTIDLAYEDVGSAGIDPASLEVTNSRGIGGFAAGVNFGPTFTIGPDGARLLVPAGMAFPTGDNTITARVRDRAGNVSPARTFAFRCTTPSPGLRPMETMQVWFLDTTRDLYTTTISGTINITVNKAETLNGVADFHEDLQIFGLRSGQAQHQALDAEVERRVLLGLRQRVSAHFGVTVTDAGDEVRDADSIAVSFHTERPAGTAVPPGVSSVNKAQADFSSMAVGGPSYSNFTIGTAFFDQKNPNEDNNVNGFGSAAENRKLGVYVTEIYRVNVNSGSQGPFRQAFDPLIPGRGTPVGSHAEDAVVLDPAFDPDAQGVTAAQRARHEAIARAIARFTTTVAATTAHECGHSMGLVANFAMPQGLYGNLPQNFSSSNDGHIKLTGFAPFTGGATNLLAPSSSFDESIHPGTALGSLNRAYLRERVLHD